MRIKFGLAVAIGVIGAIAVGHLYFGMRARAEHRSDAADVVIPPYAQPQRVVYHVTDGDMLFNGHSLHVVQSIRNHLDAVPKDMRDIRVVLQGNGVDMLLRARTDTRLATEISALKADGVRFLICRNTLVSRHIDVEDLFDARPADLVAAGVAEVSALQGQGFAYLRL